MKFAITVLAMGLCCAVGSVCCAFDTIKTTTGSVRGTVKDMTRVGVSIEQSSMGGLVKEIPVNEIVAVFYDGEPNSLKTARSHILSGHFEDGLASLNSIKAADVKRDVVTQDLEFYKALCASKLALAGSGKILDAAKQMARFLDKNTSSYHFLEATETMGNLALANGSYDKAEKYYATVAKAPWIDYKMRAGVALGRARLAQNKVDAAKKVFEAVLAMNPGGEQAKEQQLAATLGKADCLVAEGNPQQAISMIQGILDKANPEDMRLHALAYNSMGKAYRKAKREKDALMAFLHVDVLYFVVPEAHADALVNLVDLWKGMHKTERAMRAQQILQERYPNRVKK